VEGPLRGDLTVSQQGGGGGAAVMPVTATVTAPVLVVSPDTVFTPRVGVGSVAPPQTVTITNQSQQPVDLRLGVEPPDTFTVSPGDCTAALPPGRACGATLTFHPASEDVHPGTLTVAGTSRGSDVQVVESVAVTGVTAAPTLAVDRTTARPGEVVTILGAHFPPGAAVHLAALGPQHPAHAVTADPGGAFQVPEPVLDGDQPQRWTLTATADRVYPVDGPAVLVEEGSTQPDGFVQRR
jgi:hypothetical protein